MHNNNKTFAPVSINFLGQKKKKKLETWEFENQSNRGRRTHP